MSKKYPKNSKKKGNKIVSSNKITVLFLFFTLIAIVFTVSLVKQRQQTKQYAAGATSMTFITRSGSNLMNNGSIFRFAGSNSYHLGLDENIGIAYPTHTMIDDVLSTDVLMNAKVVRSTTMGVSTGCALCIEPSLNNFNDSAFEIKDYTLKVARDKGIRLIIPLTDKGHYYEGGKHTFTDWRGVSESSFFTNTTVIQDYENYISHLLNHVNQYTGIAWKDDPTIMAWETGNEIGEPNGIPTSWTETIAAYIKSVDKNHLVADGEELNPEFGGTTAQLQAPDVDMFTSHHYPINLQEIQTIASETKQANKVYFVGEYDWTGKNGGDSLASFLSAVETNPAISGDLYWSLFGKLDNGTYENHNDGYTLHYPGDTTDMQQRVQMLSTHALTMSPVQNTATPTVTPILTVTPTPTPTSTPITNLFQNSSFDNTGLTPWFLALKGSATATVIQDGTTKIDGIYSAKVNISRSSSTDYYIQLSQNYLPVIQGKTYTISFWAKASKNRTGRIALQQDSAPWANYLSQTFNITTNWKQYTYTFTSPVTLSDTLFTFNLAQTTGNVWIDKVSLQ